MTSRRQFLPAAVLVTAGLALTGLASTDSLREGWLQARLRHELALPSPSSVEVGGSTLHPGIRLVSSAAGLDAVAVAAGDDTSEDAALRHAPVVLRPLAGGPLVVAGHRDRHFAALARLSVGDAVLASGPLRHGRHVVERVLVALPEDRSVLHALDESAVVLVTCFPFDHLGPAPQRFLVILRPAGTLAAEERRSQRCCAASSGSSSAFLAAARSSRWSNDWATPSIPCQPESTSPTA